MNAAGPPPTAVLSTYLEHEDKLQPLERCSLGAMLVLQRRTRDALAVLVRLRDQLQAGTVPNAHSCFADTLLNLGIAYHFSNNHAVRAIRGLLVDDKGTRTCMRL
jgi:hypothetical protein